MASQALGKLIYIKIKNDNNNNNCINIWKIYENINPFKIYLHNPNNQQINL